MNYWIILFQTVSFMIFGVSFAYANEEHEQHDKHVHGTGELNLVVEGQNLQIELHIPAMNIVGFEHEPENQEQEKAVREAIRLLKNTEQVFMIPPKAECRLRQVEVHSTLAEEHEEHEEHQNEEHDEESHSEFEGSYHFQCNTSNLSHIMVRLFEHFTSLEELESQIIVSEKQVAQELTAKSSTIYLAK